MRGHTTPHLARSAQGCRQVQIITDKLANVIDLPVSGPRRADATTASWDSW